MSCEAVDGARLMLSRTEADSLKNRLVMIEQEITIALLTCAKWDVVAQRLWRFALSRTILAVLLR